MGAHTNGNGSNARTAGLGWLSIGLGIAELAAPRSVGRLIGAGQSPRTSATLRALGLRELTSGIGLLTRKDTETWLWSRVAGDLIDLALVANVSGKSRAERQRLLATGAALVGVTVLDGLAAVSAAKHRRDPEAGPPPERTLVVKQALTINHPPEDVYAFWRDLRNMPKFMSHVESVEVEGSRSRWRAHGPAGIDLSWEAELLEDRPGELLHWRSLPGAALENEGTVKFRRAPGGRGTELRIAFRYEPPLGLIGLSLAKLFGAIPSEQVLNDLRRFKQILETGEVVHSDASIHAGLHPAQPSSGEGKELTP